MIKIVEFVMKASYILTVQNIYIIFYIYIFKTINKRFYKKFLSYFWKAYDKFFERKSKILGLVYE
jgi:hypothetical protein